MTGVTCEWLQKALVGEVGQRRCHRQVMRTFANVALISCACVGLLIEAISTECMARESSASIKIYADVYFTWFVFYYGCAQNAVLHKGVNFERLHSYNLV